MSLPPALLVPVLVLVKSPEVNPHHPSWSRQVELRLVVTLPSLEPDKRPLSLCLPESSELL